MGLVSRVVLGACAVGLCLGGATGRVLGNAAQPRIYVSNGGSGTIAEYDLQSHALVESSVPISPWGAGGNAVVLSDGSAIILPATYDIHKLRTARGEIALNTFSTYPPTIGPLATNGLDNFFAIDTKFRAVDEYVPHPKVRHKGVRYDGGGIGHGAGLPTHMAADSSDLWVTADNATVTHFSPSESVQSWTYPSGTVFADAYVDASSNAWVLFQSALPTYFADDTSCSPEPSGPVTRYAIAAEYVGGQPAEVLYGQAGQNPVVAHIAVDENERVYVSASHVILDFDPGTQCPDDALTIGLNEKNVLAPLATYAADLYVADPVANAIDAYQGGTTTRLWRFTQPTGQSGPVSIHVQ
jgi:hypothetical protein